MFDIKKDAAAMRSERYFEALRALAGMDWWSISEEQRLDIEAVDGPQGRRHEV